jgi:hypothetical protein
VSSCLAFHEFFVHSLSARADALPANHGFETCCWCGMEHALSGLHKSATSAGFCHSVAVQLANGRDGGEKSTRHVGSRDEPNSY